MKKIVLSIAFAVTTIFLLVLGLAITSDVGTFRDAQPRTSHEKIITIDSTNAPIRVNNYG